MKKLMYCLIAALIGALSLAGCASGADYERFTPQEEGEFARHRVLAALARDDLTKSLNVSVKYNPASDSVDLAGEVFTYEQKTRVEHIARNVYRSIKNDIKVRK